MKFKNTNTSNTVRQKHGVDIIGMEKDGMNS